MNCINLNVSKNSIVSFGYTLKKIRKYLAKLYQHKLFLTRHQFLLDKDTQVLLKNLKSHLFASLLALRIKISKRESLQGVRRKSYPYFLSSILRVSENTQVRENPTMKPYIPPLKSLIRGGYSCVLALLHLLQ